MINYTGLKYYDPICKKYHYYDSRIGRAHYKSLILNGIKPSLNISTKDITQIEKGELNRQFKSLYEKK